MVLKDRRTFIYRIDRNDTIIQVNDQWLDFARENDFDSGKLEAVVGSSLWDHIQDGGVRHLYRIIFERIRNGHPISGLPYRCDAPQCRRFMEMNLRETGEMAIEITSRIVRQEPREPVPLLSDFPDRSDDVMVISSYCKKVRIAESGWVEIEEAIMLTGVNESWPLPGLSHSICDPCYAQWEARLDD